MGGRYREWFAVAAVLVALGGCASRGEGPTGPPPPASGTAVATLRGELDLVDLTGPCGPADPVRFELIGYHDQVVANGRTDKGTAMGSAINCRYTYTFSVRLPQSKSYTLMVPGYQLGPPVTFEQLSARGFRYDYSLVKVPPQGSG